MLPDDFVRLWGLFHQNFCLLLFFLWSSNLVFEFLNIKKVLAEIFTLFDGLLKRVKDWSFVTFSSHNHDHFIALDPIIVYRLTGFEDFLL